jgi:hypothetical protein
MTDNTVAEKSFLGVPVRGDITKADRRAEQHPIEELAPKFQALLDEPLIAEFGWQQYTPYFNDGDACVFGVRSLWVRTTEDSQDLDHWSLLAEDVHPTIGGRNWRTGQYEGEHEEISKKANDLDQAIQSGQFDDVLQEHFGDHAEITVTREGIEVEFYSHD